MPEPFRAGAYIYGGDYNPEQWAEHTWHEDARLMREANVNLVSVGIFSWARIQPAEGEFDFEWLDRVLEILNDAKVAVNLATATASPPPWLTVKYPEVLPVDREGRTYWHGSRQAYAPTSPVFRRLASDLVHRIADRYGQHPAVRMWHLNNELGCHVHADYSDNAAAAFRVWLERRYGDIAALNEAWGTMFWSQRYSSFQEIFPPRYAPYSVNPSQTLDFKRFTSDSLLDLVRMETDLIRSAGAAQPMTTNFMGAFEPADYRSWAPHLDLIADDNYPDPNDPEAFREAAFTRDLMRNLKRSTPWVLMEQATNAVNWRPSNARKAPGQMAVLSVQAIARGADGVMFFQWRQSRAGSEKFHSAMVPQAGTGTRIWAEVVELGTALTQLPQLSSAVPARVAITHDWQNRWAIENRDHPVQLDYLALVRSWYDAFHRANVVVDVVHPEDELGGYDPIVAPLLYQLTAKGAEHLRDAVHHGATLITGPFTDIVDEHDRFRDGGFTTQLRDLLGVQVIEFNALALTEPGPVHAAFEGELNGTGVLFAEEMAVEDAAVTSRFVTGPAAGKPALTSAVRGEGTAHYLATMPDRETLDTVAQALLDACGIQPVAPGLNASLEAVERDGHLFVINHSPSEQRWNPPSTWDLVHASDATFPIEPYGWRIYAGKQRGK